MYVDAEQYIIRVEDCDSNGDSHGDDNGVGDSQ